MKPKRSLARIAASLGLGGDQQAKQEYAIRPEPFDLNRRWLPDGADYAALDTLVRDRYRTTPLLLQEYELPNRLRPMKPEQLEAMLDADARAAERMQPLFADQAGRLAAARERAIDALSPALRKEVERALQALAEAEEQLASKRARLRDLPLGDADVWIHRRAQLSAEIDGLEALVTERTRDYRRLCWISVAPAIEDVTRRQEAEAAQAVEDARIYYTDMVRRARQELGRLKAEQQAIGAIRAQSDSPATVEYWMGRVVSVEPRQQSAAERLAERGAVAVLLRAGARS